MAGVNFNDTNNKAGATGGSTGDYEVTTYVPVVSSPGGVDPQYSSVTARVISIGKMVYVDILMTGDGGNEGSGSNSLTITLPFPASASILSHGNGDMVVGQGGNGSAHSLLVGVIAASASIMTLRYWNVLTDTNPYAGANQNNTTRTLRLHFFYEKA